VVKKLALGFGVLVASCIGCALPKPVEHTKFERQATGARKATVQVDTDNGNGTGWYVWTDGTRSLVVTAGHVCEPDVAYEVVDFDGTKTKAEALVDVDTDDDTCVLLVVHEAPNTLPLGVSSGLTYGSRLFYVGFPASRIAIVDGYYAGRDERPRLLASVWGFFGASGSALLDNSGKVVGMLVAINPQFPQQSSAVPVEMVRLHVAAALLSISK
jgi:S1-C subfamily serine protease